MAIPGHRPVQNIKETGQNNQAGALEPLPLGQGPSGQPIHTQPDKGQRVGPKAHPLDKPGCPL